MDLVVTLVGGDRPGQPLVLALGQVLDPATQDGPDPVQRVTGMASMAEGLLLDPAADLVHGVPAEPDQVKRVDDRDRVRQLIITGVLVPSLATGTGPTWRP